MRKPSVYTCDVCAADKGDVNHWFVITHYMNIGQFTVQAWEAKCGQDYIRDKTSALHICGQQCLGKKVAELSEKLAA